MSARYNKVDDDPNDILLGYLREFCYVPCGEEEVDVDDDIEISRYADDEEEVSRWADD